MVSAMGATALTVPRPILVREHRLEDLARRLSRELGIELKPDEKSHGISAQTWLSGKSDRYSINYCDNLIYDDGPSNTEDEDISIKKIGEEYPSINIEYPSIAIANLEGCSFTIDVSDDLVLAFAERYKNVPQQPLNYLHRRIAGRVASDIATRLKVRPKPQDIATIVYSFKDHLFQFDLDYLTGDIVRHFLA